MKITRRQLRRLILSEVRLLNEGNDEATYKLVTDKLIDLVYAAAEEERPKSDIFSYEIFAGRRGDYYQFNFKGPARAIFDKARTNQVKKGITEHLSFKMDKIVEEHLNVDTDEGQSGGGTYTSWILQP